MSDRYFPLDMQYHKPPTVGCEWDVWSSAPSTSTSTSTSNSTSRSAAITPAASPEKSTDIEIDTKPHINIKRIGVKFNVSSACEPCKKSHLGCDTQRPCRRCKIVGKEAFCIDLTPKKRGRPAQPKKGNTPLAYGTLKTPKPKVLSLPNRPFQPTSLDLFELFLNVDLTVLRTTVDVAQLTGFLPGEVDHRPFTDLIHPSDHSALSSLRDTLAKSRKPKDINLSNLPRNVLVSPANGMPEPYPHANVKVLRSDLTYEWFNARFHIGGALGADLARPQTMTKAYLVVSLLRLKPEVRNQPLVSDLPSFSSFTAAVQMPWMSPRMDQHQHQHQSQPKQQWPMRLPYNHEACHLGLVPPCPTCRLQHEQLHQRGPDPRRAWE